MFRSVTLCSLVLVACVGTEDADEQLDEMQSEVEAAEEAGGQLDEMPPEAESMLVDGVLYSHAQFTQRFEPQALHWVVTQESLDRGVPMAFSNEEARDKALGRSNADSSMAEDPADASASVTNCAILNQHINYRGGAISICGNAPDLRRQGFNDKASSVRTHARPIIMYEHINFRGCSFGVGWGLGLPDLRQWNRCGGGNWNDKVSSVRVL